MVVSGIAARFVSVSLRNQSLAFNLGEGIMSIISELAYVVEVTYDPSSALLYTASISISRSS